MSVQDSMRHPVETVLPSDSLVLANELMWRKGIHPLVVIAGAGHLFEESGKLAQVSQYAAQWFTQYLTAAQSNQ